MSGAMMPPGGAPPMGGGAPQMGGGAPPQIPPQILAMLMQRMQGGGQPMGGQPGGAPMMPPGGGQPPGPMGQGAPPGGGGMPPGQMGGAPPPIPQPGQASQMAQMGRNGDSVMAHMQPGEIAIPRQVQTPQLLAMLRQAFAQAGLSPQQFTAGSPMASHNPATGAPEFNILSSLLPVLGAIAGGYVGGPAGAAVGGGFGGAAGGYMNGDQTSGVLLSGLGGAAGGYVGGGGLSDAAAGAGSAAGSAGGSTLANASADQLASQVASNAPIGATVPTGSAAVEAMGTGAVGGGATTAGGVGGSTINSNPFSSGSGGLSGTLKGISAATKPGLYAGIGSSLGGALAPNTTDNNGPPGFNKPLPAVNPAMARGTANSPTPMFNNYNPYQAVTGPGGGYNFFPNTSSQPGIPP